MKQVLGCFLFFLNSAIVLVSASPIHPGCTLQFSLFHPFGKDVILLTYKPK